MEQGSMGSNAGNGTSPHNPEGITRLSFLDIHGNLLPGTGPS